MSAAVANGAQFRLPSSWAVGYRNLLDAESLSCSLHKYLGSKFHPFGPKRQCCQRFSPDCPQPTMGVRYPASSDPVQQPCEDRHSDISIEPGHRTRQQIALEPGSYYEISAVSQEIKKCRGILEIICVIRVNHYDAPPLCNGEAFLIGSSVSSPWLFQYLDTS